MGELASFQHEIFLMHHFPATALSMSLSFPVPFFVARYKGYSSLVCHACDLFLQITKCVAQRREYRVFDHYIEKEPSTRGIAVRLKFLGGKNTSFVIMLSLFSAPSFFPSFSSYYFDYFIIIQSVYTTVMANQHTLFSQWHDS